MMKIIRFLLVLCVSASCFAAKPQKLTVILDWFINPDHAPLIIAKQQGFFAEQGLEVDLIGPADPSDPAKWVAADKADIALSYQPELMEQIDQGLPLIRIGTLIDKPLNCVVALESSHIKTPADLKGKRIGTSNSGLSNLFIKVMLQKQGLKPGDVELMNVQYNLTQALLSHQVDAVAGIQRNVEVPELEAHNQKLTVFFPEAYGIPNYSELIFITNKAHAHDNRFPRFLAAIKKAVRYLDEHPKETWTQFAKQYPEANNPVNQAAWFTTMPYFAEDPAALDHEEWQHFADFLHQNKLLASHKPLSHYAISIRKEA
jgi:putative hydroxymethylpyrimidine transport system substrate-binding protein